MHLKHATDTVDDEKDSPETHQLVRKFPSSSLTDGERFYRICDEGVIGVWGGSLGVE